MQQDAGPVHLHRNRDQGRDGKDILWRADAQEENIGNPFTTAKDPFQTPIADWHWNLGSVNHLQDNPFSASPTSASLRVTTSWEFRPSATKKPAGARHQSGRSTSGV